MRVLRINKAQRLCNENIFNKFPIEKNILNIQLLDFPLEGYNKGEYRIDGACFHHMTKCVEVIDTSCLSEALGNKSDLVTGIEPLGLYLRR